VALFAFITGVVLPPISLLTFVAVMSYRFWVWSRLPQPAMTLFPRSENQGVGAIVKEILFFPTLFRGDRPLWLVSWVFHVLLLAILVAHVLAVLGLSVPWGALGLAANTVPSLMGTVAGVMILVATVLLIGRRLALRRVREISAAGDYFALVLILAIVVTGNVIRFQGELDMAQVGDYFADLVALRAPRPPMNGPFLLHFLLAQILLLYMPVSKMLHFGGVFFTQIARGRR
jgi:nitrate reductase gamma subunit